MRKSHECKIQAKQCSALYQELQEQNHYPSSCRINKRSHRQVKQEHNPKREERVRVCVIKWRINQTSVGKGVLCVYVCELLNIAQVQNPSQLQLHNTSLWPFTLPLSPFTNTEYSSQQWTPKASSGLCREKESENGEIWRERERQRPREGGKRQKAADTRHNFISTVAGQLGGAVCSARTFGLQWLLWPWRETQSASWTRLVRFIGLTPNLGGMLC